MTLGFTCVCGIGHARVALRVHCYFVPHRRSSSWRAWSTACRLSHDPHAASDRNSMLSMAGFARFVGFTCELTSICQTQRYYATYSSPNTNVFKFPSSYIYMLPHEFPPRVFHPTRKPSTGWFKAPPAVPLLPAVSFCTKISAGIL